MIVAPVTEPSVTSVPFAGSPPNGIEGEANNTTKESRDIESIVRGPTHNTIYVKSICHFLYLP